LRSALLPQIAKLVAAAADERERVQEPLTPDAVRRKLRQVLGPALNA